MRGNKITQKIILGFIIFNLFFPQLIFAQTEIPEDYKEYLQIPEKDAKDILKSLSSFFRDLPYTSYDFLYSMEGTVLLTFQEFTKIDTWNFLTKELPAEIGFNIAKYSLEVAKVVGAGDFNSSMAKLLDLFEKESAKRATDYAIQELFKNEIKTAPGAFDVKYDGRNKQKYEARMQYIIVQKSLGDDRYSIAIKIFSPKAIEPPESSSSIGGLVGVPHEIPEGEKIPPFIIEVSGLMKKDNTGFYWIDEQGNRWQGETSIGKVPVGPKMIHVSFPEEVPDLGIQPRSFWEKNIVEPLKEKYKDFASIFEKFFGVEIINPEAQVAQEAASNEEESTEEAEGKQEELQLQPDNQQSQPKQQPAPSSSISSQTGQSSEAQSSTPSASSSTPSVSTPSVSSSSQASTDLSQLSEEEKNQILINIIYELQRRVQEQEQQKKAQQEEEERRQALIKVIEELLRRQQEQQNQQQLADKQQQEKELPEQNKEQEEKTQQQEACQAKSININTAPANELQKIIGIGPTLAQRIIEARPFSSIKDLVKVNGIGDKTLEKIISQGCAYVVGDTGVLSDGSNSQGSSNNQNSSNNQGSDSNQNNNNQGNDVSPTVTFCSQKNLSGLVPALSPVIINEVAWMGNENSATQEWIELKNISGEIVSLENWQLLDKEPEPGSSASRIKIVFNSQDSIPAGGFYLLERTKSEKESDPVPNISADKIYSGALSDINESLRLFDRDCNLIDEVLANPKWPAGDGENKKSMERNSAPATDWHNYSYSNPDQISGLWATPKNENSPSENDNFVEPEPEESGESEESENSDDSEESEESEGPEDLVGEQIPQLINDLVVDESRSQYNQVVLSWTIPSISGVLPENISYDIYYSRNQEIDFANPQKIQDYVQPVIQQESDTRFSVIIPDLYYDSIYYFYVLASDQDKNILCLSNIVRKEIPADNSPWPMIYHDARHTSKTNFAGPTKSSFQEIVTAAKGEDDNPNNDQFLYPPVIDENGTIYLNATVDGKLGLCAFDPQGKQKWFIQKNLACQTPTIGRDGTIYFSTDITFGAVSPSGKLKWEQTINWPYTKNILLGTDNKLYLIAGDEDIYKPVLITLEDQQTLAEKTYFYDLSQELSEGESYWAVSNTLTLDEQNNSYLFINKKLLKINSQGEKIAERIFESEMEADYLEAYRSELEKYSIRPEIRNIFLASDETLLVPVFNGYCAKQKEAACSPYYDCWHFKLYALDSQNFSQERWEKIGDNFNIFTVNTDQNRQEFYYAYGAMWIGNAYGSHLFGAKLSDGEVFWEKHWYSRGNSDADISIPVIDGNNNIYFAQNRYVLGYALISDPEDPENSSRIIEEEILNVEAAWYVKTPVSLGNGILYVSAGNKLNALIFSP